MAQRGEIESTNQRIDERDRSLSSSTELNYSANGRAFAANEEVLFVHAPMSIRSVARPERIKWKPAFMNIAKQADAEEPAQMCQLRLSNMLIIFLK